MVPLRFVTENFGADVSYDDATGEITVVKKAEGGKADFSSLLKRTTKKFIGDSYHKWYMPIPKEMSITDRTFDGFFNLFKSDDEKKEIIVKLYEVKNTETIDSVGATLVSLSKDCTLIDNYKKVDSKNREYYYVKYKSKEYTFENKVYLKNSIVFYILSSIKNEASASEKQEMSDIVSKFLADYENNDSIEDLSYITEDGYRLFEDKKMKASLKVPADWHQSNSDDKENEFEFVKYNNTEFVGRIVLEIYSRDNAENIEQWANRDLNRNRNHINSKCIKESLPVTSIDVNGMKGFKYSLTTDNNGKVSTLNDIFFEKGNYRYNFVIDLNENILQNTDYYNTIFNSLVVEELDTEEIGKLLRYESDNNDTLSAYKNEIDKYSIEVPAVWEKEYTGNAVMFYDPDLVYSLRIEVITNNDSTGLNDLASMFNRYLTNKGGFDIETSKYVKYNDNQMFMTKYSFKNDSGNKSIIYYYIYAKDKKIYNISLAMPYLADSKYSLDLCEKMMNSFKLIE